MAYSLTQELIRTGALMAWIRPDQGTFYDFSGNGNTGSPSVGCLWNGGGVAFSAITDEITIADVASMRLTTLSIAAFGHFRSQVATEYLVAHDNAGSGYSFGLNATQLLFTGDGVTRTLVATVPGRRMLGVSAEIGGVPTGYADGLSLGSFSGAVNITAEAVVTEIGNWNNSGQCLSPLTDILICNRILTATEFAELMGEHA